VNYFRPMSLYDQVDDPVLDTEPIAHGMPPRDRFTSGLLTLVVYITLGVAWIVIPPLLPERTETRRMADPARRQVDVLLDDPSRPAAPGRFGGGDGTIDPAIVHRVVNDIVDLPEPPAAPTELPKNPVIFGDPTLPQAPGGVGLRYGTGLGAGGGRAQPNPQATTTASTALPALRALPPTGLVVLRSVSPRFSLRPGQTAEYALVVVRIVIDMDGHVSSAKALEGPEYLWRNAEQAALQWQFSPLAASGFTSPQNQEIKFHYTPESFRR
jgi:hypothetical protein